MQRCFSLLVLFSSGVEGQGHIMTPKGTNPTSLKEGSVCDHDAQYSVTLDSLLIMLSFLCCVGLVLGFFTKDLFYLTEY